MHQLNKLLLCIKQNPELFKKPNIGFVAGLTSTQIKELKILSNNILDNNCNNTLWIDRIATSANKSRVLKNWYDSDITDYKVKLKELALKFVTIESVTRDINARLDDSFTSLLNQVLQLPAKKKNIFLRRVVNG